MKEVVIIGGGMSGLTAAVTAAQRGCHVTLLEQKEVFGKKISITGNGKCNLSNTAIHAGAYVTDDKSVLGEIISAYLPQEQEFWDGLGLMRKEKNGGIYPVSNRAGDVVEVLLRACRAFGVKMVAGAKCVSIRKEGRFSITYEKQKSMCSLEADVCILACGGLAGIYGERKDNGFGLSKELGLSYLPSYPALVQAKCRGGLSGLAGIRQDAKVTLLAGGRELGSETGELQFTAQGLSGICVFQLTLMMGEPLRCGQQVEIKADLLPEMQEGEVEAFLFRQQAKYPSETVLQLLQGTVHPKLAEEILRRCRMDAAGRASQLSAGQIRELAGDLKGMTFAVRELNGYENAQVSVGGIPLASVDGHCRSREIEDLYVTGEMLNVAGKCGGYNLFFAAASGYLAGNDIG